MRLVGHFNRTNDMASVGDAEDPFIMPTTDTTEIPQMAGFPGEALMILSAMQAVPQASGNRRATRRDSYRTRAMLRLFSDGPLDDPTTLYTRDVHDRGIGFITRERLPLGYGGVVALTLPNGKQVQVHCTVFRCRETINGWFEGALSFTRPQTCWG